MATRNALSLYASWLRRQWPEEQDPMSFTELARLYSFWASIEVAFWKPKTKPKGGAP